MYMNECIFKYIQEAKNRLLNVNENLLKGWN